MLAVMRTWASVVWFALATLTIVSWMLGTTTDGMAEQRHVEAGVVIIVVAVVKVRLVGLYFMELRYAPTALRTAFEIYCAALSITLVALYALA